MYIMSGSIDVVEKLSELMKLFDTFNERLKIMDGKNEELKGEVEKCNKQLEQITSSGANAERDMADKINAAIDRMKQTIGNVSDGDDADDDDANNDDTDKAGTDNGNNTDKAGIDKAVTDKGVETVKGADNGVIPSLNDIGRRLGLFSETIPSKETKPPTTPPPQEGGGRRRNRGTKRKQKKDKRTTRRRRYTRGKK